MRADKLEPTSQKPWDSRLAGWLVSPLVHSPVHPNVLTTVRLLVGIAGAVCFAGGEYLNTAAFLIVASNFLDHTDGELARRSGKFSTFGHRYDLVSDAIVTIGMFVGIGFGLAETLGPKAIAMGTLAGLAVAAIFHLRADLEARHGKTSTQQPNLFGFESEDILYLLPVVTLTSNVTGFLWAAAIGAPIASIIVYWHYRTVMSNV